jgi:hypothetical protein
MKVAHSRYVLGVAGALLMAAALAFAQSAPPPPPPPPPQGLEPLPEIPPPPGVSDDSDLEPQVTIKQRNGDTIEETRVNGRLVRIKVTPRNGRPYFLVPDDAGNLYIRDGLGTGLRVPMWLLFEF